jgi:hypothetical protein
MKSTKKLVSTVALMATLFALSGVPVSFAAEKKPVLTKHELKVLLKTAKESPEHRQIAEYYRQEAQRLTAEAKEHQEMAAIYAQRPPFPAMEAKHGDTFPGVGHCRKWAQLIAEQAKEAEALAELHEEMAKAAEQKN